MRKVISINRAWKFQNRPTKNGKPPRRFPKKWETVDLPHTWNAFDGQDGGSDYYRNTCVYCKEVESGGIINALSNIDKSVYLELCGANSVARVFVNGSLAGYHEGGFSTYRCDITHLIKKGRALITIEVDNRTSEYIYPQMADFTFFGGLYRDVNLIIVNKSHFDLDYFGGPAIMVTPKVNEDGSADVTVEAFAVRTLDDDTIRYTIGAQSITAPVNEPKAVFHFDSPHLWDGRNDPFLYEVKAELIRHTGTIDNISTKFGIRTFSVDPDKGFFLNGKPYPLRGVSRHQDRLNKGWAVSRRDHKEDMELIKEVGANTIRLAHYQHDQYFYDLCDENGMIVWAEIPFISSFMPGEKAEENTLSQMKELIIQNYNHPSIVCWGIANEISIGGITDELLKNLNNLNSMCHELDKTRLTTIANLSIEPYDSPLNFITDILSYNHYFGWYAGDVADNGPWFDEFHKANPDRCIGLSEYGCEGITAYHNDDPKVQDYSEEYQAYYHEKMLEMIEQRPFIWSTHVWNMFDFASDMRDEGGVKGRNNKGLVTFDRRIKKDAFYIYKAHWSSEPFVHICSKRYIDRTEKQIDVKVYSNCPEVTLRVNGEDFSTQQGEKIFLFKGVLLNKTENIVVAVSGDATDTAKFRIVAEPNSSYVLKNAAGGENASNWFDNKISAGRELEFPDGCFSVRDKIGDIMKTPEGEELINGWIDKISVQANMTVSKGMMNMVKNFTVERVFAMAGDRVPIDIMFDVNESLNKIKKP